MPIMGKHTLERVPHGGLGSFMKHGSNTIGSQADKNWSNMGHYQKSEIEAQLKKIQQWKRKYRNVKNLIK